MPNALLQQLLIRPRCRLEKAVNLSENYLPPRTPFIRKRIFLNIVLNNHVLCVKWLQSVIVG